MDTTTAEKMGIEGAEDIAAKASQTAQLYLSYWLALRDPHDLIAFEEWAIAHQRAEGRAESRRRIAKASEMRRAGR
ncbi:MAG: hypothetical protein ACKO0Z_15105 [Betaproteobacteria bacterium]